MHLLSAANLCGERGFAAVSLDCVLVHWNAKQPQEPLKQSDLTLQPVIVTNFQVSRPNKAITRLN